MFKNLIHHALGETREDEQSGYIKEIMQLHGPHMKAFCIEGKHHVAVVGSMVPLTSYEIFIFILMLLTHNFYLPILFIFVCF